jgi:hypothetical protein
MKLEDVPQDHSSTYGGHSKLVYAVDASGHYQRAQSDGWDTEAFATQLAVAELQAREAEALAAWQAGERSPLHYLMFRHRLDVPGLAHIVGLWQWRVRRHFQPVHYARLSPRVLARYSDAFGIELSELLGYQQGPR